MTRKFALILWFALLPAIAQTGGAMSLTLRDGAGVAKPVKQTGKAEMPAQAAGVDQAALIARYGTIIGRAPLGAGGLTAWTVEKNGRRVVLYTTADSQAIISGVVWESGTGRNLSDQFNVVAATVLPPAGAVMPASPAAAATPAARPALVGTFSGPIPESIKTVDSLAGIKEGKGGQADTLYIIFDPRCPYCRMAYAKTREYVKKGFTIKWIPAVALGNPEQGLPLAASVLQAKPGTESETLRRVLGEHDDLRATPTKATEATLDRNLTFFFETFKNNDGGQAGVPVAFYLDKNTGKPRMMKGLSEAPVIESIFGKL